MISASAYMSKKVLSILVQKRSHIYIYKTSASWLPYSLNVKSQVLSPRRYNRILVLPITGCKDFPSSVSSGISQALQ